MELTNEIRFKHYGQGDDHVVVILRQPTPEEVSRFLKSRFPTVRNKTINQHAEARIAFVDRILKDVEGLTIKNAAGEKVHVGAAMNITDADRESWRQRLGWSVSSWKDLIPAAWKCSWALQFEENQNPVSEEGEDESPL